MASPNRLRVITVYVTGDPTSYKPMWYRVYFPSGDRRESKKAHTSLAPLAPTWVHLGDVFTLVVVTPMSLPSPSELRDDPCKWTERYDNSTKREGNSDLLLSISNVVERRVDHGRLPLMCRYKASANFQGKVVDGEVVFGIVPIATASRGQDKPVIYRDKEAGRRSLYDAVYNAVVEMVREAVEAAGEDVVLIFDASLGINFVTATAATAVKDAVELARHQLASRGLRLVDAYLYYSGPPARDGKGQYDVPYYYTSPPTTYLHQLVLQLVEQYGHEAPEQLKALAIYSLGAVPQGLYHLKKAPPMERRPVGEYRVEEKENAYIVEFKVDDTYSSALTWLFNLAKRAAEEINITEERDRWCIAFSELRRILDEDKWQMATLRDILQPAVLALMDNELKKWENLEDQIKMFEKGRIEVDDNRDGPLGLRAVRNIMAHVGVVQLGDSFVCERGGLAYCSAHTDLLDLLYNSIYHHIVQLRTKQTRLQPYS